MPNLNSLADQFLDWDRMLQAFLDNAEILAPAEPQRAALEKTLQAARDLKARQESHTAVRQETTQSLDGLIKQGREEARRLRGMVKGLLGTKNERLVQFRVAPIRARGRKAALKTPTPPPATAQVSEPPGPTKE